MMKSRVVVAVFAGAAVFSLSGCWRTDSAGLDTEQMFASYAVTASQDRTDVSAQLNRWSNDTGQPSNYSTTESIELSHGDCLTATTDDGDAARLVRDESQSVGTALVSPVRYAAELPPADVESRVDVVLRRDRDRDGGDDSFPSTVTLPPAPVLLSPQPGSTFSREKSLVIELDDPGDDLFGAELISSCGGGMEQGAGTGFVQIEFDADSDDGEECDVTVTVWRERFGALSDAFLGGDIRALRAGPAFTLRSTP